MMLANISVPRWNYICRFQIWPYFRGELRDFEKMYNPMTISELKRYLFTSKLYFGVEVLSLYALTESPLGQHRKKTWFSGKQPPPCISFCLKLSIDSMSGSVVPSAMFLCVKWCHDFKTQSWPSLAGVYKLATGWLWCPGKNENGLKCCCLSFVYRTLKIIQVIFGCFQACCFAVMMF